MKTTTIHVEELCRALETMLSGNLTSTEWAVGVTHLLHHIRTGRTRVRWSNEILAKKLGLHRNAVGRAYSGLQNRRIIGREATLRRREAVVKVWLLPEIIRSVDGMPAVPTAEDRENSARPAVQVPQPTRSRVCVEPARSRPDTRVPAAEIVSKASDARFVLPPPLEQARLLASLAPQVREALADATLAGEPERFEPRPEWDLTPDTVAFLRSTIPDRRVAPEPPSRPPASQSRVPQVAPTIAAALAEAAQRLPAMQVERAGRAVSAVLDEIAYSVATGQLGAGNALRGVRAALAIVRRGAWTRPRGMTAEWRGIGARYAVAAVSATKARALH